MSGRPRRATRSGGSGSGNSGNTTEKIVLPANAFLDTLDTTEDEDESPPPTKRPRNKSKTRRPADDSDDEDDETFHIGKKNTPRPTNILTNRIGVDSQTAAAYAHQPYSGIVKSIKMWNFMCHDGFFQEWHPNLNFITGENGSGKSALLTGLLIGLGAMAKVTSRTKSMTSLIQKGKDSARTEITLMNFGCLSSDKYGAEITIERTISKSGTSAYRLVNNGRPRKIKKNELDFILLALNIQLDNPVAILNQEVAKNFLRSKDPKDKYQLFYQGTLLSKLFKLLSDSAEDMGVSDKNLSFHKNVIVNLKEEVDKIELKLSEYENLKNIKENLQKLNSEYIWSLVYDEEKNVAQFQRKCDKCDTTIQKFLDHIAELQRSRLALEGGSDPSREEREATTQKINEKEKELAQVRKKLTVVHNSGNEAKAKLKATKPQIIRKKKELLDAQEMLETVQSTSAEDEARAVKAYEDAKEKLTTDKSRIVAELGTLKQDRDQFRNGLEKSRDEMTKVKDEDATLTRLLEAKNRNLENLQKSGSNSYVIFGRNMENLMTKINANKSRFKKLPRGPIGSCLTVKDPKYIGLIEFILKSGDFLATFMVDNGEDMIILRRLIQECYPREALRDRQSYGGGYAKPPSIKVNTFRDNVYNLSDGMAKVEGVKTLLEMIEVEKNDPVIINGLADYVHAEKILLFGDNTASANVLKQASRCRNVKFGYTLDFYKFFPAPMFSAQALSVKNYTAAILKSSKRAQIQGLKAEVQELRLRIDSFKPEIETKRREEAELRQRYGEINSQYESKRSILETLERKIRENERNKYTPPDVASHIEEIADMQADLKKFEDEVETANTIMANMNAEIEELKKEREEFEHQIQKLQKKFEKFDEERNKVQEDLRKNESLAANCNRKLKQSQAEKKPFEEKLKKAQDELTRKTLQAEGIGERVETNRSPDDVKAEHEQLKVKISTMEEKIGNVQKLQADFKKKKSELKGRYKEYRPTYRSFLILQELIQSQLEFLFKKRTEISNGLSITYQALAEQRGYKGKLIISHEREELHFFICPDKSSATRTEGAINVEAGVAADKNKNKALIEYSLGLSGGERSFSTICFILSLWQVMECPFYMLDEFDVFMDAFNRKASQQALMSHAKSFNKNQFFLFSPLDLVEIPAKNEATVIRLQPARPDAVVNADENVDPENIRGGGGPSTSKALAASNRRRKAAMAEKNRRES